MKKSICSSGFKDWHILEVIDWSSRLEIDGIELWIGHIDQYQAENGPLDKLQDKLQQYGFEVPIISDYTNFSGGFSGERDLQEDFKSMQRLLDVARQLKCPLVRTFVGHVSSRIASPEQWGQMIHDLKSVMTMADQYEVNIAVEVHYHTFADEVESVQMLMQEINHPRLKLVFDGANLHAEQIDQLEALTVLYPWVKHVHLKNYKWDHRNWYSSKPVPVFNGDIDNKAFIKELEKREYQAYISLEYFGENKCLNIRDSLNEWK